MPLITKEGKLLLSLLASKSFCFPHSNFICPLKVLLPPSWLFYQHIFVIPCAQVKMLSTLLAVPMRRCWHYTHFPPMYQMKNKNFNFPKVTSSSGRLLNPKRTTMSLSPFLSRLWEWDLAEHSDNQFTGESPQHCSFFKNSLARSWMRPVDFSPEYRRCKIEQNGNDWSGGFRVKMHVWHKRNTHTHTPLKTRRAESG